VCLYFGRGVSVHMKTEKNISNLEDQNKKAQPELEREREREEKEMTSEEAHHLVSNIVNGRPSSPCVYEIINVKPRGPMAPECLCPNPKIS
jgi:hypothetical protein